MAAHVSVHPCGHDLRRVERSAAQYHLRARARTSSRGSLMPDLSVAPQPVSGHGLLTGRAAVITAAAGTGIGSATARRLLAEGADVVVSDWHERRLGETEVELKGEFPERRVFSIPC